ncbi:rRNA maturation RNase YbeY [Methylacidiphilum kamchatkense]|nr:rRNA maturation RNase YbeY [Methylacidiphilum kamchatkense]
MALGLMPKEINFPQKLYFVLLSSKEMGEVHARFFNDPTPTDVISFDYGEILICPFIAEKEANARAIPVVKEVLLYGIHGMLHLCGLDDQTEVDRQKMERMQTSILESVWIKLNAA